MKALVQGDRIFIVGEEIVKTGNNYRAITGEKSHGISISGEVTIIDTDVLDDTTTNLQDYKYNSESGEITYSKRKWSKKDFGLMLLTGEELMKLEQNAENDSDIFQAKFALYNTGIVDLDDWATVRAMELMVSKGLLTEERKEEILAGTVIVEM